MKNLVKKISVSISYRIKTFFRNIILWMKRKKLKKTNISVISSNCVGGCILHDLNLQFNSPTVNLSFNAPDFVKFCENLPEYLGGELHFFTDKNKPYPCAKINDVTIDFVHYNSNDEAKNAWERRKNRIVWENLYFILCERDGCSYDVMSRFDSLTNKKKILLTHKKYGFKCEYVIPGFGRDNELGNIIDFKRYSCLRYYDQFDFVDWINKD